MVNGCLSAESIRLRILCAQLAVNAKQLLEHSSPTVAFGHGLRRVSSHAGKLLSRSSFDGVRQGFGSILGGPGCLVVQDNLVHVTAPNSHYRRPACLTLEGDEPERLLHAGVNEKIGRSIILGEHPGIRAVLNPGDVSVAPLQVLNCLAPAAVSNHEKMKGVRPAPL